MSTQPLAQPLAALSDQLADVVERTGASVVALHARRSHPSSALIWQPGVVVTAAHTIRRDDGITAILPDGTSATATLVGVDPATDIAVVRVDSPKGVVASLGDAATVRAGHYVVAVARAADGSLAASSGIVARASGEWRTWRGGLLDRGIHLDGGLWPGFSGGPIVDARGAVVGIGTSALSRGRGVVIPVSVLRRVSEQLLAHGRVSQAYIGAAVQPVELPSGLRERLTLPNTHGLIIVSTVSQGPADAAGLTIGDTLLALGDVRLAEVDDLRNALSGEHVGNRTRVTLLRGGQLTTAEVTLGERPHQRC
jgi:serine protease Do